MAKRETLVFVDPILLPPAGPAAPATLTANPIPRAPTARSLAEGPATLTPEQLSICRALRITPEKFAAALVATPSEPVKATDLSLAEAIEIQRQHAARSASEGQR